jgi:chloramphenicol 3-O phosphotransferase
MVRRARRFESVSEATKQLASCMVGVDAIVLNGGSSSGKSSLARCLQSRLGPGWLTLGVDDLIRALQGGDEPNGAQPSFDFLADASISVSDDFCRAEAAWYRAHLADKTLTAPPR